LRNTIWNNVILTHRNKYINPGKKMYANIVEDNYCNHIRIFDISYFFSIDLMNTSIPVILAVVIITALAGINTSLGQALASSASAAAGDSSAAAAASGGSAAAAAAAGDSSAAAAASGGSAAAAAASSDDDDDDDHHHYCDDDDEDDDDCDDDDDD
jgi:hypothetical protein